MNHHAKTFAQTQNATGKKLNSSTLTTHVFATFAAAQPFTQNINHSKNRKHGEAFPQELLVT